MDSCAPYHLKEVLVVVEQDSHRVKAGLLQLTPHYPLDTNACMIGSDVSLAEYLCTHVAIIYIFTEDAATPSDGFYVDVDINE